MLAVGGRAAGSGQRPRPSAGEIARSGPTAGDGL